MNLFADVEQGAYEATLRGIRRAMAEMGFAVPVADAKSPPSTPETEDAHDAADSTAVSRYKRRSDPTVADLVVAALAESKEPMNAAALAKLLGPDTSQRSLGAMLSQMVAAGRIARADHGFYTSVRKTSRAASVKARVKALSGVMLIVWKTIQAHPRSNKTELLDKLASDGVDMTLPCLTNTLRKLVRYGLVLVTEEAPRFARYSVVKAA